MNARTIGFGVGALLCAAAPVFATDVVNQDKKSYALTILDGSVTSKKTIGANGTIYGLCGSDTCTFSITGSKIVAGKNDRIIIRDGKLSKP